MADTDKVSIVRFAPDVVLQIVDGDALLLKLDEESVFALNRIGARVAELVKDEERLDEVIAQLTIEFDADVLEIEQDVRRLIDELAARRLVIVQMAGDSPTT